MMMNKEILGGGNVSYGWGVHGDHHVWVPFSYGGSVPPHAVHAGHDSNGDAIFVGRSHHSGDWLPAKVIPNKQTAYVCWGGQEIPVHSYEVLTGHQYTWAPSCGGGNVPPGAVTSGTTSNGEPLYIGRGHWQGSITPGKVHPSHHCLYIPYGGQEVRLDSYEVLVRAGLRWIPASGRNLPPQAILAGHDTDGDAIYVGRAHHEGDLLPAKVVINKGQGYVAWGGQEHVKHSFEVLCGEGYNWVGSASGHVPPNAVDAGQTSSGERLYIGRGSHHGSLTPGKVQPSHHCLYIPYGGQEVRLSNYEVLCRSAY